MGRGRPLDCSIWAFTVVRGTLPHVCVQGLHRHGDVCKAKAFANPSWPGDTHQDMLTVVIDFLTQRGAQSSYCHNSRASRLLRDDLLLGAAQHHAHKETSIQTPSRQYPRIMLRLRSTPLTLPHWGGGTNRPTILNFHVTMRYCKGNASPRELSFSGKFGTQTSS